MPVLQNKKAVVIGGGLAGTLLCNELVKSLDVTLLEKGDENRIRFPRVSFDQKKFGEVNTFCFGGGGTTNLWHNGLIPINPGDITDRNFREVLNDPQPYMDQAASALFFKNGSYLAKYEDLMSEFNTLSENFSAFPHGLDCLIYPKKYKKLRLDARVNGIYDVRDIDFAVEDGKLLGIRYETGGLAGFVEADCAVISAGALGSPGIIQEILIATGTANDKAGLGFIDHPMGFVGKVKFNKDISDAIKKFSSYDKGEYIARGAVRLKSECGQYTSCVFFRPALTMANNLPIYKYKSSLGAGNGRARLKNIFSPKLFHPDILAEIYSHLLGLSIPGRTFNILFIADQKRGNNRVYTHGDELRVDWRISDHEISIYQDMLSRLQDMLSGLAEEINIKTDISRDWLWSAAHHSGTTPMGDSEDDLIDRDLRLKCCRNVFVCDGSVIQEHSYANTGLAIGQLAFRLADKIKNMAKE